MYVAGDLDTTFGPQGSQGIVTVPIDLGMGATQARCAAMTTDAAGRIVMVGSVNRGLGNNDFVIVRMTAKGVPDKTFGAAKNGRVVVGFEQGVVGDDRATCVTVDTKGRIVVGGDVEQLGGYGFGVVRLTPQGKFDATFSGDGRAVVNFDAGGLNVDRIGGIATDKTGRVVMVGSAETGTNSARIAIARLTTQGQLDGTFDGDGRKVVNFFKKAPVTMTDQGTAVAIDSKQRIVFTGRWASGGAAFFGVGRLKTNGGYDTTFATDGFQAYPLQDAFSNIGAESKPTALRFDSAGRIYVTGSVERADSTDLDFGLIRVTPTGDLDTSYGLGGGNLVAYDLGSSVKIDAPTGVAVDPQGRVIVVGVAKRSDTESEIAVARLNAQGFPDLSFGANGKRSFTLGVTTPANDSAAGIRIDKAGRILVAATAQLSASSSGLAVVRILA